MNQLVDKELSIGNSWEVGSDQRWIPSTETEKKSGKRNCSKLEDNYDWMDILNACND